MTDGAAGQFAGGEGRPFAPAGKVFREWLAVDGDDEDTWRASLADALAFAGTR